MAESTLKKVTDTVLISPLDPLLVIDEETNFSRMGDPWDEERLKVLEESLEKHGQLQPCRGYLADDGKIHLMFGFGRALASKRIAKRNADWKLKIQLEKNVSEDRMADANVAENHHRRLPNHADMAIGIKRRLDAGYSRSDVAALFMCSEAQIDRILPLNKLNRKHLDAIRTGDLLSSTALDCLRLKDTKQRNRVLDRIVSEAKRTGERLTSRAARKLIQDSHGEGDTDDTDEGDTPTPVSRSVAPDTSEEPAPNGKNGKRKRTDIPIFARTVPDIRDFFQNLKESPVYPASVNEFGGVMLEWIKGTLGKPDAADNKAEAALEKVFLDNPKGQKNLNDEDVSGGWTAT